MDSLQISTGEKRIAINGDETRIIIFDPSDLIFAEKFYRLIGEFQRKLEGYRTRSIDLEKVIELDENDMPVNMNARLELVREACTFFREKIDALFGEGASQKCFDDVMSLDAIQQFFEGITPFIRASRNGKIDKYLDKKPRKVMK